MPDITPTPQDTGIPRESSQTPGAPQNIADQNAAAPNTSDTTTGAHQDRIQQAFGSLHQAIGQRASKKDEERVLGIREAVASGNKEQAEQHLTAVKQESSWLYDELLKHPEISATMQELSIMGF